MCADILHSTGRGLIGLDDAVSRPRGSVVVGGFGVAAVVAIAVVASGPWTSRVPNPATSLWALSTTAAVGTAAALVGAGIVTAAQLSRLGLRWVTRISVVGCVVGLLGAGFALLEIRRPERSVSLAPVTVAIGQFQAGPNQVAALDRLVVPSVLFVAAGGLVVLTLVGAVVRTRPADTDTARATRPTAVVALVGAVVLALGASLPPWGTDPVDLHALPLCRSSDLAATAAALLLAAAGAVTVLVHRSAAPRVAVVVAVLAGLAGASLLASRTSLVRPSVVHTLLLRPGEADGVTSSAAALTVYAGAGLVFLATVAAVSLAVLRSPAREQLSD